MRLSALRPASEAKATKTFCRSYFDFLGWGTNPYGITMPLRMTDGGLINLSYREIERLEAKGFIHTPPAPVSYAMKKWNRPMPFTEWRINCIEELYRLAKRGK